MAYSLCVCSPGLSCTYHRLWGGSRAFIIRRLRLSPVRAVQQESVGERIWREYDRALEKKDLGKAIQILETVEVYERYREVSSSPFVSRESEAEFAPLNASRTESDDDEELMDIAISPPPQDLRKVLDSCLNATDMKLVHRTYDALQSRGLLPNFGRYYSISSEGPRDVTPAEFSRVAGLEASKLSPKKWGLSGSSVPLLLGAIILFNFSVNNGVDVRPTLISILALLFADSFYLGGSGFAQVLSIWPPFKRRVLVHEAGHILIAYLLGCPVRGVILDPIQAMNSGIQGQAGTQFWDGTLQEELRQGRLTNASLDRYSMVLFAGIAAEALVFGEAEGGENDENLFKAIISNLRPPWSVSQMSNQARWAVLQSFRILKEQRKALDAVTRSLNAGASLGAIVREVEDALAMAN